MNNKSTEVKYSMKNIITHRNAKREFIMRKFKHKNIIKVKMEKANQNQISRNSGPEFRLDCFDLNIFIRCEIILLMFASWIIYVSNVVSWDSVGYYFYLCYSYS